MIRGLNFLYLLDCAETSKNSIEDTMHSARSLTFFILLCSLCACAPKKVLPKKSDQHVFLPFVDINNPSSLNLEELKDLPNIVDLKDIMTSVKDQDARGTCSFFVSIGLVEAAIKKELKKDVNLSEEFLNYDVKSKGSWPTIEAGDIIANLITAINNDGGFLLERDWPYQPTWFSKGEICENYDPNDSKAPSNCFSHNAPSESVLYKKIAGNNFKLVTLELHNTNDIIKTIASGTPISVNAPVHKYFGWNNEGRFLYDESMRQKCISAPKDCGFHSMILTGYDLSKEIFYFKNSWGKSWGNKGYGTIPFKLIDKYTQHLFATVELANKELELPIDYDKDYFKLNNFSVTSKQNGDFSVQITPIVDANNVGAHTLKISSTLVKKFVDSGEPSLENVRCVQDQLNCLTSAGVYHQDSLIIESEKMMKPEVSKLINDSYSSIFISTSLLIYTDDSKYINLKRLFHPVNSK